MTHPTGTLANNPIWGELTIPLGGEKSGFEFSIKIEVNYEEFEITDDVFTTFSTNNFVNNYSTTIRYSSPSAGVAPIITLDDDASTWEVGDTIVIASTDFDARNSETFVISECANCEANQIQLDRPGLYINKNKILVLKLHMTFF